ncbi:MAG TPA: hypothetical protein VJT71_17885 [Pyrinomonadaceae bacterium]|nr:hypothetical protein [Pyrinomonadaceae bacterium]
MLFKSLPLSHRVPIFIAVFYTATTLIGWKYGAAFTPYGILMLFLVWTVVVSQAVERRKPNWQSAGAWGGPNPIDAFGSWFDRLPAVVKFTYWLVVILAAILIYRFV